MKEYKVGDKVTIKSLDWYNENKNSYGDVDVYRTFIKEMSKYCGQKTVITDVFESDTYKLECDKEAWNWTAEMFEEETEEETMKYKVGDKVRLKSQEWYDNHKKDEDGFIRNEGIPLFNPEMREHLGQIATIIKVMDDSYYFDIDNGYWNWGDYMIEYKVNGIELKEESKFNVGDFVQIKSEQWYNENKNDDQIEKNGIFFEHSYCGKIGEITEYDSSDDTYKVQFDPDDEYDYEWFVADWMDKTSNNRMDASDNYEEPNQKITEGDWIYVADKYHNDSPREDWVVAKFEEARIKGIDTEYGIWNYFIPFSLFNPKDWKETLKHIYTGKDRKIIKVNE